MSLSKTQKLIRAFKAGQSLTAPQIRSRFGLTNPTAVIWQLRDRGYDVATVYTSGKSTRYRFYAAA